MKWLDSDFFQFCNLDLPKQLKSHFQKLLQKILRKFIFKLGGCTQSLAISHKLCFLDTAMRLIELKHCHASGKLGHQYSMWELSKKVLHEHFPHGTSELPGVEAKSCQKIFL